MLQRSPRTGVRIEPCLPSPAKAPPPGPDWLHEIKHDGFRLMAQRGANGVRLYTRNGNDFTARFPLVVAAVATLPVRSCLIDGEDLRLLPIEIRKAGLVQLLRNPHPGIVLNEHYVGDGEIVYRQACKLGCKDHHFVSNV